MPEVIPNSAAQPAQDPVAMISALLDKEKVTPDTPTQESQPPQEDYQPGDNAQVEGADAPEEKGETAEIPLEQLESIELEVEVQAESGKETRKLPIKELKLGYMRQQDYHRKTAEVARQRDEVGAKVRQGIEGERTRYLQALQELDAMLVESVAPELKNVDWNHLATNDPLKYVELRNRHEQQEKARSTVKQKLQDEQAKAQVEAQEQARDRAQRAWQTLESDITGWNAELYKSVLKQAESVGFTEAEASTWLDPRAIKLLHKAHLYDQLKVGKPPADKKVVAAPKAIAPTKPAPQSAQRDKAKERLRSTGKTDDLAAYLSTMM